MGQPTPSLSDFQCDWHGKHIDNLIFITHKQSLTFIWFLLGPPQNFCLRSLGYLHFLIEPPHDSYFEHFVTITSPEGHYIIMNDLLEHLLLHLLKWITSENLGNWDVLIIAILWFKCFDRIRWHFVGILVVKWICT